MARAMLSACHNSMPAALRVYELLLARRAPGVPDADLSQLRLKVRLRNDDRGCSAFIPPFLGCLFSLLPCILISSVLLRVSVDLLTPHNTIYQLHTHRSACCVPWPTCAVLLKQRWCLHVCHLG